MRACACVCVRVRACVRLCACARARMRLHVWVCGCLLSLTHTGLRGHILEGSFWPQTLGQAYVGTYLRGSVSVDVCAWASGREGTGHTCWTLHQVKRRGSPPLDSHPAPGHTRSLTPGHAHLDIRSHPAPWRVSEPPTFTHCQAHTHAHARTQAGRQAPNHPHSHTV